MGLLSFFATGQGILLMAAIAAVAVLVWDWRVMLVSLVVLQVGVAALATTVARAPAQLVLVQTLVMGLCCVMLATSGLQMRLERAGRQSGGWFFRLMALGLLAAALYSLELRLELPLLPPGVTRLFVWLGLVALLMLSLGDNPLFTSVALLLWCVLGQVLATVYMPVPEVLMILGVVPLTIALTCSYLIVSERMPRANRQSILTDISFPSDDHPGDLRPAHPSPATSPATSLAASPATSPVSSPAVRPGAGLGANAGRTPAGSSTSGAGAGNPPPTASGWAPEGPESARWAKADETP